MLQIAQQEVYSPYHLFIAHCVGKVQSGWDSLNLNGLTQNTTRHTTRMRSEQQARPYHTTHKYRESSTADATTRIKLLVSDTLYSLDSTIHPQLSASNMPARSIDYTKELNEAEMYWVQEVRRAALSQELKALHEKKTLPRTSKLNTFRFIIDGQGLLRVGGRLELESSSYANRHSILLPREYKVIVGARTPYSDFRDSHQMYSFVASCCTVNVAFVLYVWSCFVFDLWMLILLKSRC